MVNITGIVWNSESRGSTLPSLIFETVDPFTPEAVRAQATSGVSFTVVVASGTSLKHIA